MSLTSRLPVLIVGAGPSGLVLALTLAQNGIQVRIIEMEQQYHLGQRGAGIQPRTLEVYNFLGVLPDIYARGIPLMQMRTYKLPGGVEPLETFYMVPSEEPTPSVPFMNTWLLAQPTAEEILRSHLDKYDCHVELGTELRTFEQHDGHVVAHIVKRAGQEEVQETVECHWLVGADGAKSIVRKQLGLTFLGETMPQQTIFGEIEVNNLTQEASYHYASYWHAWRDAPSTLVMLRPTEKDRVFTFAVRGGDKHALIMSDDAALVQALREGTQRDDIDFGRTVWKTDYRANVRMVNKFGEGCVFVVGDAAHVHTPAGGQGMNTGVQDAFNLGWKLALVEKGLATSSLLSTFSEERIPVIRHMLGETTKLYNSTLNALRETKSATAGWFRGAQLKQLGVNYRWSSIVVDERNPPKTGEDCEPLDAYGVDGGVGLRAGDRAPDAPGLVSVSTGADAKLTSLFRTFGSTHHTVLLFTPDPANLTLALQSLKAHPAGLVLSAIVYPKDASNTLVIDQVDRCFVDGEGHASMAYGISAQETAIVIVRPDGIIGGIVRGVDGLKTYFRNVFSTIA
ncbi:uncharacterized protein FIBRA_03333 [Fibroporia radiculosa]|uniref:Uncharacterized protein n=1 Tax=Fibroporia radiculosa TaxID=599839 RepID=J4H2C5_9APHY|nr:uncharacterized protein FIBRA_03333 [Fibroporia radiculosa]CCM01284.1 predicted protein [Fibroporia radiculosa]